tara:strand:- start:221 stop:958 length:738 start_codon:yes stop_codon:yes gene_type:complete
MMNINRQAISSGGPAGKSEMLDYLLNIYHNDPRKLTDSQKQEIAQMAYMSGRDFDVESKPISKGLFDLVDTAAIGMIPNSWRPSSIGQEYFGESGMDKFAGGLGTAAGIVPGIFTGGALLKGGAKLGKAGIEMAGKGKGAYDAYRAGGAIPKAGGKLGDAISKAKEVAARARASANARFYKGYDATNPINVPFSGQAATRGAFGPDLIGSRLSTRGLNNQAYNILNPINPNFGGIPSSIQNIPFG